MTQKDTIVKQLWNMIPYDNHYLKIDDNDISKVSNYKMFPSDITINNNDNYFKSLKQFLSPHCVVPVIDYSWTTSPVAAREDIPYIIFNEKRVWKNNTFAKLIYSLSISKEYYKAIQDMILKQGIKLTPTIKSVMKQMGDLYNDTKNSVSNFANEAINYGKKIVTGETTTTANAIKDTKVSKNLTSQNTDNTDKFISEETKNSLMEFINKLKDKTILDDIAFCNTISNLKGPTNSYNNLYLCLNTGFQYILPYFDNNMRSVNNTWQINDKNVNPILAYADKAVAGFNKTLGSIETTFNLSQEKQGFYFEQSKPYSFPDQGETFNIQFPLINTNTWEDVVANWQFVFLLLYQNQPTRTDISIIEPPVLYEIEIPNVRYIPYAYISSLKIEYIGTRRNMKMPIMKNNKIKEITTIIPEAWNISIDITGLTSEPTNFNILNNNIITTRKL